MDATFLLILATKAYILLLFWYLSLKGPKSHHPQTIRRPDKSGVVQKLQSVPLPLL